MRTALRAWLLAAAALIGMAGGAGADTGAGERALEAKDYPTARREFEAALRAGDPAAAFYLGLMADRGLAGPVDPQAAARFYTQAAGAGLAAAQTNLGQLYDNGRGVPRHAPTAERLYSLAAKAGSATSKNNLAYLWSRQQVMLEEALCLSAETLRAEPGNQFYRDTYGFVLMRMGRLDEAESWFKKALAVDAGYAAAIEHLGDVAQLRGQMDQARAFWLRAMPLARFPTDAARINRKLGGAPDFDEHPPYDAKNDGFGRNCAVPTV